MNGGVSVWVGSGVNVGVDIGSGVNVGVDVDFGVNVGSIVCSIPQPDITKITAKKQTGIIRCFVFITLLLL